MNAIKKKIKLKNNCIIFLTLFQFIILGCAKKRDNSSGISPNGVSEIRQSLGSDGYYSGSFKVPANGISFLLSIFKDNNAEVRFYSLTDPDGINILSGSSSPNLYYHASGSPGNSLITKEGYSNILVPQSPSFSTKKGTWKFKAYNNDRVKITLRSGSTTSTSIILVQPFITGTTWSAADIESAITVFKDIYSSNGIKLTVNNTIFISDSKYSSVNTTFTNSTTSNLISQGEKDSINLFFVEDFNDSSNTLGIAAGIPGSMGIANSWNGVLISLNAHATGSSLDSQLLGETAAHEMGHQIGLFHTSEYGGTNFDILSDTAECSISRDNDSNGTISAEECDGFGADNVMFWTIWGSSSRAAGKKQNKLSDNQTHVIKFSPIAI